MPFALQRRRYLECINDDRAVGGRVVNGPDEARQERHTERRKSNVEHDPQPVMELLQVQVLVLSLKVLLFESGALDPVLKQRGLSVSDDALSTCELLLLVKESTEGVSYCRSRRSCTQGKTGNTRRISCGRPKSDLGVTRGGRGFWVLCRGLILRHFLSSPFERALQRRASTQRAAKKSSRRVWHASAPICATFIFCPI
jgi:hypothetical protein